MHILLLFTGSAAITLVEEGGEFGTMFDAIARMLLPMLGLYGWEAGSPLNSWAIAVFSIVSAGFLLNAVFNFGSVLVPSLTRIFNRRKKVNYNEHFVVWGCNTHLDEVIRQMSCTALGKKRKPITILADSSFFDEAKSIVQRHIEQWNQIDVIQGTALKIEDLQLANIKNAKAILLLPPENEENPDLTVALAAMTVRDILDESDLPNKPTLIAKVDSALFAQRIKRVADKVICASERDFLLVAEAAFFPVVVDIYSDLMTISEDTNEIYAEDVPKAWIGKDYTEIAMAIFAATRNTSNPATVIGTVRKDKLFLNPMISEFSELQNGDRILIMAMCSLDREKLLEKL